MTSDAGILDAARDFRRGGPLHLGAYKQVADRMQDQRHEMKALRIRVSGRADRDKRREEYASAKSPSALRQGGSPEDARAAYDIARRWAEKNVA
jgi:hypothetical protein